MRTERRFTEPAAMDLCISIYMANPRPGQIPQFQRLNRLLHLYGFLFSTRLQLSGTNAWPVSVRHSEYSPHCHRVQSRPYRIFSAVSFFLLSSFVGVLRVFTVFLCSILFGCTHQLCHSQLLPSLTWPSGTEPPRRLRGRDAAAPPASTKTGDWLAG